MSFVMLGLLGTALFGAVAFDLFDDSSDDEGDGPEPDDPQPDDETGQELSFDGSDLLEGSEGDDTLPAGQDEDLAPEEINLLGGNDTAITEVNDSVTLSGGDGADTLTATGVLNTLDGGAGNDTLTADDSNRLFGGEGDDELNFTHGSYDQGEEGSVNGGAGDDTINVQADAVIFEELLSDVGGVGVRGGDGADEINIVYDLDESDDDSTAFDSTVSRGFVSVSDFNPGEDSLVVEVDQGSETEERNVTVELDQTEDNGTYTSLITLTFEETSEYQECTNILTVLSSDPFTLDDIQLVGVDQSAASLNGA